MEAQKTQAYQTWDKLSAQHWDDWQSLIDKYDFALQKPANTFFTRSIYPGFYQLRLLRREFALNMQQLGEVTDDEVEKYHQLDPANDFPELAKYHLKGSWLNLPLLGMSGLLTLSCILVRKPVSWLIVPPVLLYATSITIVHRIYTSRIGEMIDFTSWAIEKRKAEVWLQELKHEQAKVPSLHHIETQLVELATNFK